MKLPPSWIFFLGCTDLTLLSRSRLGSSKVCIFVFHHFETFHVEKNINRHLNHMAIVIEHLSWSHGDNLLISTSDNNFWRGTHYIRRVLFAFKIREGDFSKGTSSSTFKSWSLRLKFTIIDLWSPSRLSKWLAFEYDAWLGLCTRHQIPRQ